MYSRLYKFSMKSDFFFFFFFETSDLFTFKILSFWKQQTLLKNYIPRKFYKLHNTASVSKYFNIKNFKINKTPKRSPKIQYFFLTCANNNVILFTNLF